MALGQHLKLRCFLEGIEVPIISAVLQTQFNAPAQCLIQIPATDKAVQFKPRTLVHVFFYDYWNGPSDTATASVSDRSVDALSDVEEHPEEEQPTSAGSEVAPGAVAAGPSHSVEEAGSGPDRIMDWESGREIVAAPERRLEPSAEFRGIEGLESYILNDTNWKLYFVGETTGFEFQKSHTSRSVILRCMDPSVYWDTCYQYKVNAAALHGNGLAAFVGAGTTFFDTFFSSPTATIASTVARARSVTQPELTGLLAGVVALLERVGGVYTGNEPAGGDYSMNSHRRGRFKGVNDFFSIAELRLKLVQMITAAAEDFSSQRVFPRRAFAFWGRRYAGRLGQIASFREILNLMNSFIFHAVTPCPIARFVPPGERQRTRTTTTTRMFAETPAGRRAAEQIRTARSDALAMRSTLQQQSDWSTETRERAREHGTTPAGYARRLGRIRATCASLIPILSSLGVSSLASDIRMARDLAASLSGVYRDAGSAVMAAAAQETVRQLIVKLSGVLSAIETTRRTSRRTRTRTVQSGQRLNNQIIRPDIFFVAPPRCNVLFPELYSQVSYSRAYMKEVTRMRLTVSDEIFGPDELLDQWYFAPDVEVLGARQRSQLGGGSGSRGSVSTSGRDLSRAAYSRRLMDHELYTGVIPMFERMNEVNMYAARSDTVTYRGARVPYVVRAANFQFFKHRFQPRNMTAQGKFNPFVAPGFPALVIDRYMTEPDMRFLLQSEAFSEGVFEEVWARRHRAALEREGADTNPDEFEDVMDSVWESLRVAVPTQYTGLVQQITHSVSQSAAQTQYQMVFAKTHRENEELLGANNVRVARRAVGRSATRSYPVAAMNEPQPGQTGRYGGVITSVSPSTRTGALPLFGTFEGDRPRRQQTTVSVGIERTAQDHGPAVTTLVGDPEMSVTFRAYDLTERVDRWRGQEVDVPLEDYIRPPWMSDIWRNDRIGSVYQQFFGTGAITDPISVVVNGQTSVAGDVADGGDAAALDADAAAATDRDASGGVTDEVYDGTTVQSASVMINVERAVDLLNRAYSTIKHEGMDVHEFIRAYTWRPVATLIDILGSRDLRIDAQTGDVLSGAEGMHSRAFGHGEMGSDLRNLLNGDVRTILGINSLSDQERENFLSRMDKRAEKAQIVQEYVDELWDSRGLLG